MAAGICLRAWRYEHLRTQPDEDAPSLAALDIVSAEPAVAEMWAKVSAGVEGALFARDLVTEPSNTLTPSGFVARLDKVVQAGVTLEVLDADALRKGGFGGLIAVGQGSVHPPCLAVLRWAGTHEAPPVIFVGKGITFDTGGISIKPADGMWEMRADMAGAAACAGAMLALARRGSPAPAIAVLAIAENATGAASYRPGDVLRMFNGSTVQVVDTDAEGRLVLADALAYAIRERPQAIIDLATLTGSIVTALGHEMAGCYDNNPALAAAAAAAGGEVGEHIWRMPITDADLRSLNSDIADIKHCVDGRGQPDANQAAAFLRSFVDETPWVHLDIAGVESRAEADARHAKGATGFGVRLLDRLVADRFEDPHRV
jgi:leucyl aminopeptidase